MEPQYAQIVSGGFTYQLTPSDVLWAGRMAVYEGGDPAASLWTLTSRYTLPGVHQGYVSFAELLRAFSQPINPKWQRDGEFCREGGRYHGTDACSEVRLKKRAEAASASWDDLRARNAKTVATVEKWAIAGLGNPAPRAVNFAAPVSAQAYLAGHPGTAIVLKAGNWFLATLATLKWPRDHVTMQFGERVAGDAPRARAWPWLFSLLAIASGGYLVLRWWNMRGLKSSKSHSA